MITLSNQIPRLHIFHFQIFRRPHPQKKLSVRGLELSTSIADKLFFHNVDNLKPCMQPFKGNSFFVLSLSYLCLDSKS